MVQNVWYSNGRPSHVTLPFQYRTHHVQYSDESGIQVSGIQIVTVYHLLVGGSDDKNGGFEEF